MFSKRRFAFDSSLKNGPLREEIEKQGGVKVVDIFGNDTMTIVEVRV
jgi:hypothetical protein